jgi:hypothetical protein|tara:strand:+ start:11914 stop:12234 length:321 start_codon:yes stop_codon:yes gene_type:complete
MATGRLGHADLAAGTNTSLYTVPANTFGIVTLSICNRGNSAISVRVAVASAGTPLDSEYIEYDVEILAKGVLERSGIALAAGQILVVYSSAVNVSAVAMGIETSTA